MISEIKHQNRSDWLFKMKYAYKQTRTGLSMQCEGPASYKLISKMVHTPKRLTPNKNCHISSISLDKSNSDTKESMNTKSKNVIIRKNLPKLDIPKGVYWKKTEKLVRRPILITPKDSKSHLSTSLLAKLDPNQFKSPSRVRITPKNSPIISFAIKSQNALQSASAVYDSQSHLMPYTMHSDRSIADHVCKSIDIRKSNMLSNDALNENLPKIKKLNRFMSLESLLRNASGKFSNKGIVLRGVQKMIEDRVFSPKNVAKSSVYRQEKKSNLGDQLSETFVKRFLKYQ